MIQTRFSRPNRDKINKQQVNKQAVARSFSQAASSYDDVATLQCRIAHNLLTKIPSKAFNHILDIGCGTGTISYQLAQKFSSSTVFCVDLAEGMIKYARKKWVNVPLHWCCADAENLPLQSNSIELIFSSLAVQWCADFQQLCNEVMRVLKPGGSCVLATLGSNTLYELRYAWQKADAYVHVNSFLDSDSVMRAAFNAGLKGQLLKENEVMYYRQLRDLMTELKALGAHNVNQDRPKGLMGRKSIKKLKVAYETFRDANGLLPASYDVYYLLLQKPK